jgi:hypothetical protein
VTDLFPRALPAVVRPVCVAWARLVVALRLLVAVRPPVRARLVALARLVVALRLLVAVRPPVRARLMALARLVAVLFLAIQPAVVRLAWAVLCLPRAAVLSLTVLPALLLAVVRAALCVFRLALVTRAVAQLAAARLSSKLAPAMSNLPEQRPIRRALMVLATAPTPAMRRAAAVVLVGWAGVLMVHAMACASGSVLTAERPRTTTNRSALTSTPVGRRAKALHVWVDGG